MAYIREYSPRAKFLNPLNEMQMSTRHFTLSSGHASTFSTRTARTTRLPLPTRQARKFLSPLNEMPKSTRQFALSPRIMSTVLNDPLSTSLYNSLKVATLSICFSNIQIDLGLVIDVYSKMRRRLIFQFSHDQLFCYQIFYQIVFLFMF